MRPANIPQTDKGGPRSLRTCVQVIQGEPQVIVGKDIESNPKSFTYDYVFGPESTQDLVFNQVALPLIGQFMEGFNTTILA